MAYIGKSPSGLGVRTRYYYTATGGETSLSGADDNGRVLKFTDGEYIDVYLNGVLLVAGTDYGTGTANTISSLDALSAGNIVEIVAYDIHSLAKPNLEALRKRYYKTATGGETSISGNDDNGAAITFAANAEIEVYLNGVALVQGDDYNTTTANTVGGLAALDADDIVSIVAYEEFTLGDVVSKKSGGTFASDVTFSQDISVGVNATITGDLTVDTDTLVVDSTNNRVGIGTTSPYRTLVVSGDQTIEGLLEIGASTPQLLFSVPSGGLDSRIHNDGSGNFIFGTGTNSATPTERMRIDSSGNVGIGTSSPDTFVQTEYTSNHNVLTITTGGGNIAGVALGDTDDTDIGGMYYLNSADALYFYSNASERMRIDSSGNVLVGTTNSRPDENNDSGMALTPDGKKYAYSTTDFGVFNSNSTGKKFYFRLNGVEKGSISFNSDGVSYTDTSDYRLKENVTDITDGIQRLKQLNPSRFNFIGDSTIVDGFIAHEAATVVPEAVTGTHNEVETWTQDEIDAGDAPANTSAGDNKLDEDGNTIPVYQGIDKSKLVPLLTAALQEAITKIEALETENATQATTIADFETRIAALEAN